MKGVILQFLILTSVVWFTIFVVIKVELLEAPLLFGMRMLMGIFFLWTSTVLLFRREMFRRIYDPLKEDSLLFSWLLELLDNGIIWDLFRISLGIFELFIAIAFISGFQLRFACFLLSCFFVCISLVWIPSGNAENITFMWVAFAGRILVFLPISVLIMLKN